MPFSTASIGKGNSGSGEGRPRQHGVALIGTDHRFVWVDDVFSQILGYTPAELVGQRFEQITHPQDAVPGSRLADRFIAGELDRAERDRHYLAKDGWIVPVHLVASWVRDPQGRALYGLAVINVIGERIPPPDLRNARPAKIDEIERIRRAILE